MHFVLSNDVVKEWVSVCSWCWPWPFVVSTWAVWWHHQSMSPPTQPAAPQPSRYHPVSVSLVCGHSWPLSIPSQSWWTNIHFGKVKMVKLFPENSCFCCSLTTGLNIFLAITLLLRVAGVACGCFYGPYLYLVVTIGGLYILGK